MSTSNDQTNLTFKKRTATIPVLLGLIFFAPFLIAGILYLASGRMVQFNTTNRGNLIRPPMPISSLPLRNLHGKIQTLDNHHWMLVYLSQRCQNSCYQHLYLMRQIHKALGKDQARVERALIITQPPSTLNQQALIKQSSLLLFSCPMLAIQRFVKNTNLSDSQAALPSYYLVDPQGNLMMQYPASTPAQAILSDLKRLLRISQVG